MQEAYQASRFIFIALFLHVALALLHTAVHNTAEGDHNSDSHCCKSAVQSTVGLVFVVWCLCLDIRSLCILVCGIDLLTWLNRFFFFLFFLVFFFFLFYFWYFDFWIWVGLQIARRSHKLNLRMAKHLLLPHLPMTLDCYLLINNHCVMWQLVHCTGAVLETHTQPATALITHTRPKG